MRRTLLFLAALLVLASTTHAQAPAATRPASQPGAVSKAVEKDGLSVTVAMAKAVFAADEQPKFVVQFRNVSKDRTFILFDAVYYWGWAIRFTDVTKEGPWRLRNKAIDQVRAPKVQRLAPAEVLEVPVDLGHAAPFEFEWYGRQSNEVPSIDRLKPGKYQLVIGINLKNPPADWNIQAPGQPWVGEITTAPVEFEITDEGLGKTAPATAATAAAAAPAPPARPNPPSVAALSGDWRDVLAGRQDLADKLKQSKVPTEEDALRKAVAGGFLGDARGMARVTALLRLAREDKELGAAGNFVWEIRDLWVGNEIAGVIWVGASTGNVKRIYPPDAAGPPTATRLATQPTAVPPLAATQPAAWSPPVGRLEARLRLERGQAVNGTPVIATFIELRNVSDASERLMPIDIAWTRAQLSYRVTDADGRELLLKQVQVAFSGRLGRPRDLVLVLPYQGLLSFDISGLGAVVAPKDTAVVLNLGPTATWAIPADGKDYYLQATLETPRVAGEVGTWAGRLELPRVLIPTKPQPLAPAAEAPPATRPATQAVARPVEVYASAFGTGKAGEQWSNGLIEKSPNGKRTFLGTFGNESTTLSLDNLPEHSRVRLSFDAMIILTWDGDADLNNPGPNTPDTSNVTVKGGPRLLNASFVCRPSSASVTQSFPGQFPYDHVPYGTTAIEGGSLGYFWNGGIGPGADDYVYHVERTFGHTGKSLQIAFSGINTQVKADECWGLDNVKVEVLPAAAPQAMDAQAFDKWWAALGEEDPRPAVPAIAALVDIGDAAVAEIRNRTQPPATQTDRDEPVRKLIAQLDNDSWQLREQASAALTEMGPRAEPALRAALKQAGLPEEARLRIEAVLTTLNRPGTPVERRALRLVEVLELIGTDAARAALAEMGDHAAGFAAFEAKAAKLRLDGKAPIPTKLELPPGLPPPPAVKAEAATPGGIGPRHGQP